MAKKDKQIRITQVRSRIGYHARDKRTLDALGLRKIRHSVVKNDTPAIRGMINKIPYLVEVSEE